MMKLNGQNIISDEDIDITNGNLIGEKLSDILEKQQNDIEKLKSNVKWLYKYGGVGSGSGSGNGGGASTSSWSIFSTLNGVQIKNDRTIGLNGVNNYPLSIKINQPQGATFSVDVTYNYYDSMGQINKKTIRSFPILDVSNGFQISTNLNLECNGTITIHVTNSVTSEEKQISSPYIIEAYKTNYVLVNENGSEYDSNNIFIDLVREKGLYLNYKCNIDVEFEQAKIIFNCETVNSTSITILDEVIINSKFTDNRLNLTNIINEDNLGYISIDAILIIDNEEKEREAIKFSLLSKDLYLSVIPDIGNIYGTNIENSTVFEFPTGPVILNVRPYYGTRTGESCTLEYCYGITTDSSDDEVKSISIALGSKKEIRIFATTGGIYYIKFKLTYGSYRYPKNGEYKYYYFKVKDPEVNLNWYEIVYKKINPSDINNNIARNFWQIGGNDCTSNFQELGKDIYLNTISGEEKTFDIQTLTNDAIPRAEDLSINIGLQYSEINDTSESLFEFTCPESTGSGNRTFIEIFQNKIEITTGGNKDGIEYFFPRERDIKKDSKNFHLLSFVTQYKFYEDEKTYYEVLIYIDGIIEGVLKFFRPISDKINTFKIKKFNGYINLIDISYIKRKVQEEDYISKINEDLIVYNNYLCYYSSILHQGEDEYSAFLNSDRYKILKTLVGDESEEGLFKYEKDGIECTKTFIENVASNINIPTILFEVTETVSFNRKECKKNFTGESKALSSSTTVSWSRGGSGSNLSKIDTPPNTNFNIEIQGTSTKTYKCKNWEFSLINNDSSSKDVYLFSPNFNKDDPSTFLPEQSFTLKADVVDSSHSNNTSIGRFVNNITKKFNTGDENQLSNHIKNCLEGFPCLVFIGFNNPTSDETSYYFEGIYNFNLGRSSYHNLDYVDNTVFIKNDNISIKNASDSFTFYAVDENQNNIKEGLIVAEIQNNSPYFDFSQYDQTILFKQIESAEKELYMFDDFVNKMTLDEVKQNIQKLVEKVSLSGGYIFDKLKKDYNTDESDGGYVTNAYKEVGVLNTDENSKIVNSEEKIKYPLNRVPNYRFQYRKSLNGSGNYDFVKKEDIINGGTQTNLEELITTPDDNSENRKPFIDFRSLSEYYTICMAFGLVDSVQKNMNIKTWSAERNPSSENQTTWYIAFYDMDTCLGIDNSGEKVEYFAFSDYWDYEKKSNQSEEESLNLSPVIVYRDYSPDGSSNRRFYDTPSSYLFAIAKYSRISQILSKSSDTKDFPQELWARWRSLPSNYDPDPTRGCLRDANYFVDNYFSNNLKSVPEILVNFNYRNKYLVRVQDNSTQFDETNFPKFHGTRISEVRDWLDGRLHILDAYFNLSESKSVITYYKKDNNNIISYDSLEINNRTILEPTYETNYDLRSNQDIFILQDIFTAQNNSDVNKTVNIKEVIRAKKLTPFYTSTPSYVNRYLIPEENKNYNFNFETQSTEVISYYGSGLWTYLSSIDSFKNTTLNISSKYLENLRGISNSSITELGQITMPNLKVIELTGKNYSGTITNYSGDEENIYLNLNEINISNSKINLDLNYSSCKILKFNYVNSSSIKVSNCNYLNEIEFSNIKVKTLSITPYPVNILTSTDGLIIQDNEIEEITISNFTNTNNSSKITIKNENYLKSLTITGISNITIEGCKSLNKINIHNGGDNSGDKVTNLSILNLENYDNTPLKVNNDSDSCIDLSELTDLERLTIKNSSNFHTCIVNSEYLSLQEGDFFNNKDFQYLDTREPIKILNGRNLFAGSNKFTLKKSSDNLSYCDLYVDNTCTDISYIFSGYAYPSDTNRASLGGGRGALGINDIYHFISNMIPPFSGNNGENSIQNISYAFCCNNITINDSSSASKLPINKFKYVTKAKRAFSFNYITYYNKDLFNIGSNSTGITIDGYCQNSAAGSSNITARVDYLYNIINKINDGVGQISSWSGSEIFSHVTNIKFVKENGSDYNNDDIFYVKNIFWNNDEPLNGIENIGGYNITNKIISFKDAFKNLPNLKIVRDSFNYISNDSKRIDLDRLFYYNDNIETLRHTLVGNGNNDNCPNLYTMFDWTKNSCKSLLNAVLMSTSGDIEGLNETFTLRKYIFKEDYNSLINTLLGRNDLIGISHIFNNCYLLLPNDPTNNISELKLSLKYDDNSNLTRDGIVRFCSTFKNFKQIYLDNYRTKDNIVSNISFSDSNVTRENYVDSDNYHSIDLFSDLNRDNFEYPIILDKDFFKHIPKITHYYRAFEGIKLGSCLPLNFFKKRKEIVDPNLYYYNSNENQYYPGKFTYYSYRPEIINLYKTFYNVKWSNTLSDDNSDHNKINDNDYDFLNQSEDINYYAPPNCFNSLYFINNIESHTTIKEKYYKKFEYTNNNNQESITVYEGNLYTKNSENPLEYSQVSSTLGYDTEINDILSSNEKGSYSSEAIINNNIIINNVKLSGTENNVTSSLITAPDLFYGVNTSSTITETIVARTLNYVLGSSTTIYSLEGMMPPNFFKNCKNYTFKNAFENIKLIPRLYKIFEEEDVDDNEETITYRDKVYTFIPDNFTSKDNLSSNYFNFLIILPHKEYTSGIDYYEREKFFIFSPNSLPTNLKSLENSLPSIFGVTPEENWITSGNPNGINTNLNGSKNYYNIMFSEKEKEGNLVLSEGIDLKKFRQFKTSGLIKNKLSAFLVGRIFEEGSNYVSKVLPEDKKYLIETFDNDKSDTNIINRHIILPIADVSKQKINNSRLFKFSSTKRNLFLNRNDNFDDSDSPDIYAQYKYSTRGITLN